MARLPVWQETYFLFSLLAFTLASILCGMATNLATLIIAG